MKLNAKMVFVAYLLLIFGYGATYYLIAEDFSVKDLSLIQSLYFSVVTITTLGFGDIAPVTDLSRIIVASEAIIGVVIIGLFLNALWQYFASTIERQQSDAIALNLQLKNTREIILFYEYFETEIVEFRRAIAELTQASSSSEDKNNVELSFEFSRLSGLYQSSKNTMSGINKPIIHLYYQKLDRLLADMKLLITSYDLSEYIIFHQRIVKFIKVSQSHDVREAFTSYETTRVDDVLLKDRLVELVAKEKTCPNLEQNSSHIITPAIVLYQTLGFQMMELAMITNEFESLKANT